MLSLRDLIVARPETPVRDAMIREPVAVLVTADEDEVAEVVAHYSLLAVPVVDEHNVLRASSRSTTRSRRSSRPPGRSACPTCSAVAGR